MAMTDNRPDETTPRLGRRALLGGAAAVAGAAALTPLDALAAPSAQAAGGTGGGEPPSRTPRGPGSVSGAPRLSAGFRKTFRSRFVHAGGIRQHVVVGGEG